MSDFANCLTAIQTAYETIGAKELSTRAGVPYTTLVSLAQRGFRPKTVDVIERLFLAATNQQPASEPARPYPSSSSIVDALPRGLSIPPQCQFPIVTETRIDAAFSGQPAGEACPPPTASRSPLPAAQGGRKMAVAG